GWPRPGSARARARGEHRGYADRAAALLRVAPRPVRGRAATAQPCMGAAAGVLGLLDSGALLAGGRCPRSRHGDAGRDPPKRELAAFGAQALSADVAQTAGYRAFMNTTAHSGDAQWATEPDIGKRSAAWRLEWTPSDGQLSACVARTRKD